jgi:hypothetical protein
MQISGGNIQINTDALGFEKQDDIGLKTNIDAQD